MKKLHLSIISSCVIALYGCGGGDAEPIADSNRAPELALKLAQAMEKKSPKREGYTLSAEQGAFAKVLQEDGWNFNQTTLAEIPNAETSILFVNVESGPPNQATLNFLNEFKGVLVLDSQTTTDQPRSDSHSNPLTNAILQIERFEGRVLPAATAVIANNQSQSLLSIRIDENGLVNSQTRNLAARIFNPSVANPAFWDMPTDGLEKNRNLRGNEENELIQEQPHSDTEIKG